VPLEACLRLLAPICCFGVVPVKHKPQVLIRFGDFSVPIQKVGLSTPSFTFGSTTRQNCAAATMPLSTTLSSLNLDLQNLAGESLNNSTKSPRRHSEFQAGSLTDENLFT
jgi:hypothetical protein